MCEHYGCLDLYSDVHRVERAVTFALLVLIKGIVLENIYLGRICLYVKGQCSSYFSAVSLKGAN